MITHSNWNNIEPLFSESEKAILMGCVAARGVFRGRYLIVDFLLTPELRSKLYIALGNNQNTQGMPPGSPGDTKG